MYILESDNTVYFDVDNTLIMPAPADKIIGIIELGDLDVDKAKYLYKIMPHAKHIEMLKQFKARGQSVVVWSQGGYAWAYRVVHVLQLEPYVDLVLSKPKWVFDDKPVTEWMPNAEYHKAD